MGAVERGASGAGEMLKWLLDRQRSESKGQPSYAEHGIRVALARFFVLRAHSDSGGVVIPGMGSVDEGEEERRRQKEGQRGEKETTTAEKGRMGGHDFDEGRALRRHASSLRRHSSGSSSSSAASAASAAAAGASQEEKDVSEEELQRRKRNQEERARRLQRQREGDDDLTSATSTAASAAASNNANLSAVAALADQLPFLSACLHANHPARVPALVAAAVVASVDGSSVDSNAEALLREALRVHDTAFGGGAHLFAQRYGRSEGKEGRRSEDALDRLLATVVRGA